ncbi:MAG: cysteine desulfurase [Pseudomonadota bacterium]
MNSAIRETRVAETLVDVRNDFPVLSQEINGKPLVYLDSAASAQLPHAVIDAMRHYQENNHANVHRGIHSLSQRATDAYEGARARIATFVGAQSTEEIVFTRGTTEAINLVASSFVEPRLRAGDEILVTQLEHHANIVPWQLLCERTGAKLVVAPINDDGSVSPAAFAALLSERTKMAAFAHTSNALGTVLPAKELTQIAHSRNVPVLIDGAQAVPHGSVDVSTLGCDFFAFSGHKMYGPTGIGCLYGRADRLADMPPWQGGGDMIREVSFDGTTYNEPPYRFEAGTPNIVGAVGLAAAVDYLQAIGPQQIAQYEKELLAYGTELLASISGLRLIGTAPSKAAVMSFIVDGTHPTDVGTLLDQQGVAIRTGHHCAMPVMQRYDIPGTARASLGIYNTKADLDRLADALTVSVNMLTAS